MTARTAWRRTRSGAVMPIALVMLLATTPASASAKNTLRVHGPTSNTLGTNFNETVSGHATKPANFVISGEQFTKGSGCAATYKAERTRSDFTKWPTGTGAVHGKFSLVARFGAANAGEHGICSYLVNKATGKTYAHASRFWTNRPPVLPPGGGKLQPAPVGSGQCPARSYADGSVTAQIAIENTTCATAMTVEAGADTAMGAPYTAADFACSSTPEGPGSPWSSAWGGTYHAYSCQSGSSQVAFNWGTDYTFGG